MVIGSNNSNWGAAGGITASPSGMQNQASSVADSIDSTIGAVDGFGHVDQEISSFLSESELAGDAHDSAKEFFSNAIQPLVKELSIALEEVRLMQYGYLNNYRQQVDNSGQYINEAELQAEITSLDGAIARSNKRHEAMEKKTKKVQKIQKQLVMQG